MNGFGEAHRPVISQEVGMLLSFLFLAPFIESVAIGQVNAFALLSILASFYLSERGRDWLAGSAVALAIALRTTPVLVLIYFLRARKPKKCVLTWSPDLSHSC